MPVAAVSLAWLAAQRTVAAPIASARTTTQLGEILPALTLRLSDDELDDDELRGPVRGRGARGRPDPSSA